MCAPENIASRRCSRPAARARSSSSFSVSRVDPVLAVVDVEVADRQRQFACRARDPRRRTRAGVYRDLIVMPRQGLPCGSGRDVGDLLRFGGHVFDPSAAQLTKGVNDGGMDTTALLKSVPTGFWIGGEERDGIVDVRRARPVRRPGFDLRRQRHPRGRDRRARRRGAGAGGLGGHPAAEAWRDPALGVREDHRACRGHRHTDDPRNGQGAAREHGRGQLRRRVLPLVRRGGRAHRTAATPRALRAPVASSSPSSRRAVLCDHPVELPAGDGHPQDRPGDSGRLHDDRQARAGDAADDAAAGQADGRGGPAQGRAVGAARPAIPAA